MPIKWNGTTHYRATLLQDAQLGIGNTIIPKGTKVVLLGYRRSDHMLVIQKSPHSKVHGSIKAELTDLPGAQELLSFQKAARGIKEPSVH